jgi:hypothetical protein
MGYRTYYTLAVEGVNEQGERIDISPEQEESIIAQLREENEDARFAIDEGGMPEAHTSWWEYERELVEFSKKHPGILFTLHGEGDDNEDIWDSYFLDGKVQRDPARMEFDGFDPAKLVAIAEQEVV